MKDQLETILKANKDKECTISSLNQGNRQEQYSMVYNIEDQLPSKKGVKKEGEGSSDEMNESIPTIES